MLYLQLFFTFFYIGMLGFGGGNAMISLIQFEIVERHGWITNTDFTNMVAISQTTPGPIGINCATYAGYLATGNTFLGAFIATLGIILPPVIIMFLITKAVNKVRSNRYYMGAMMGLKPAIVGLVLAAALLLMTTETFGTNYTEWISWMIFGAAFIALKWLKLNPILLVVLSGLAGVVIYS